VGLMDSLVLDCQMLGDFPTISANQIQETLVQKTHSTTW